MSLALAANPACCAAVLTSLFTSASAEAGHTPMADSQVHARASAPNIVSPRFLRMISLPLFGKAGCAELKDEEQGCASPFLPTRPRVIPQKARRSTAYQNRRPRKWTEPSPTFPID